MASFICHVVCVTKRLRLERLVRRQLARMVHSPTPDNLQPNPWAEHYNTLNRSGRAARSCRDVACGRLRPAATSDCCRS